MEDFGNNDDLYLEIADFSSEDGYIRYPVYNSTKRENDADRDDVIPFSTYYLEALILNLKFYEDDFNEKEKLNEIDLLIAFCEYAFFNCNSNNRNVFNEIIRRNTDELRKILQRSDKGRFGIYANNFFNYRIEFYYKFLDFYDDWVEKSKKILNHSKIRGNCVAIAMPIFNNILDSNNCYLSLSGVHDDYAGNVIPTWGIKTIKQSAYDAINNLLDHIYGFKFKECHFIDDVMRYTYFERLNPKKPKKFDRTTVNGRVLKKPVYFFKDYRLNGTRGDFNAYYSCCERKIIAHMGFINTDYPKLCVNQNVVNKLSAYEFRIRFQPCRMCRPALIGCYFIGWGYSDLDFYLRLSTLGKTIKLSSGSDPKEPLIVG